MNQPLRQPLGTMDSHTNFEILAGCLQDPHDPSTDMGLVFPACRKPLDILQTPYRSEFWNAKNYYVVPLYATAGRLVASLPELLELILVDLAQSNPRDILINAIRVNRRFRDVVKDSKHIKKQLWKKSSGTPPALENRRKRSSSIPGLLDDDGRLTHVSNPVLDKYCVEYPAPGMQSFRDRKFALGRHSLTFDASYNCQIHLSDYDENPDLIRSCDDMWLIYGPDEIKLEVTYRGPQRQVPLENDVLMHFDATFMFTRGAPLPPPPEPTYVPSCMIRAKVTTSASTVAELIQVAQEVRRGTPNEWHMTKLAWGWEEGLKGSWSPCSIADACAPHEEAVDMMVSAPSYKYIVDREKKNLGLMGLIDEIVYGRF